MTSAHAGGVAFFAHIGGFVFGMLVTTALLNRHVVEPRDDPRVVGAPVLP